MKQFRAAVAFLFHFLGVVCLLIARWISGKPL